MTPGTVIHAWVQSAPNRPRTVDSNFWGIGDLLRGTSVLFEACRQTGNRFQLDIGGHPVSNHFVGQQNNYDIDYNGVSFETFSNLDHVKKFINRSLKTNGTLILNTNGGPDWPPAISSGLKLLIREALTPTGDFAAVVQTTIPKKPYNVFHFRIGDKALVTKDTSIFDDALLVLEKNIEDDDIIISDSIEFKTLARDLLHANVSDSDPVHTGVSEDLNSLKSTLFEFVLATRAKKLKTFSNYYWTSGFVAAASKLYDVPLHDFGKKKRKRKFGKIRRLFLGKEAAKA